MEKSKAYTVSKDFSNRSHGVDDWESVHENHSLSSTTVTILEIFPEQLVAKIYHPQYSVDKKTCVPYLPDSGILTGSLARMDIHSGAPIITKVLKYGVEVKDSFVIDLDPTAKVRIKKGDAKKYGDYKNIAFDKYVYLLKEGEKAYYAGKSVLKLGLDHIVLSEKGNSEIILRGGVAESYGKTAILSTDYASISANTQSVDGSNTTLKIDKIIKANSNTESEAENLEPIYREYRGACSAALKDDGISLQNIPNGLPNISDLVYLDIMLNPDIDNFKINQSDVTSTYSNRKLSINGSSPDLCLNSELGTYVKLDFQSYSSGIATVNDKKHAIVYLKSITKTGDTVLFQAGKNNSLVMGKDITTSATKTDITLKEKSIIYQDSVSEIHLPVNMDSFYIQDRYHRQLISNFGKTIKKDYAETYENRINSFVKYDIDSASGISTGELHHSPSLNFIGSELRTTLNSEEPFTPLHSFSMKDSNENSIVEKRTLNNDASIYTKISYNGKKATIYANTQEYVIDGVKSAIFNAQHSSFNGDVTVVGKLNVGDGISSKGNFLVDAKSIQMQAKDSILLVTDGMLYTSSQHLYMKSDGDIALVGGSTNVNGSNEKPMLIMSDKTVQLFGNSLSLIGINSASLQSKELVSLSAKNISVPGYVTW